MGRGLFWRSAVLSIATTFTLGGIAIAQPSFTMAPGHQQPVLVGLGDSVAAGAGLPLAGNASLQDQLCARSPAAYVNQVAQALGMQAVNLACSGATAWNGLISDQETSVGEVPSQLKQVHQGPTPAAAVLTVGANDTRWTLFLAECARSDCATESHTRAFHAFLASARVGLQTSLTSLRLLGVSRVYVTGYYDPLAGSVVPGTAGFTAEEVAWYQARLAELNQMIAGVAGARAYATFVPVSFNRSGLVQTLSDPAPFHPTVAGQAVIAGAVIAAAR